MNSFVNSYVIAAGGLLARRLLRKGILESTVCCCGLLALLAECSVLTKLFDGNADRSGLLGWCVLLRPVRR